jgi:hypothetical protein
MGIALVREHGLNSGDKMKSTQTILFDKYFDSIYDSCKQIIEKTFPNLNVLSNNKLGDKYAEMMALSSQTDDCISGYTTSQYTNKLLHEGRKCDL